MSETPIVNIQERAGNGNSESSILAAMLGNRPNGYGDGFGGAGLWPLLLLAGRGGFFGGDRGEGVAAALTEAQVAANITGVKDAVAAIANAKDFVSAEIAGVSREICGLGKEIACTTGRLQEGIAKIENLQLMTTMQTEKLILQQGCELKGLIAAKTDEVLAKINCIEMKRQEETICALRARLAEIEQTDAIKKALLCGPCGSGVFPTPTALAK